MGYCLTLRMASASPGNALAVASTFSTYSGLRKKLTSKNGLRREASRWAGSTDPGAPVPVPAQAEKASETDKIARTR